MKAFCWNCTASEEENAGRPVEERGIKGKERDEASRIDEVIASPR